MLLFLMGIHFLGLVIFLVLTLVIGFAILQFSQRLYQRHAPSAAGSIKVLSWLTTIILTPAVWALFFYVIIQLS
jgi:hypothetical protein